MNAALPTSDATDPAIARAALPDGGKRFAAEVSAAHFEQLLAQLQYLDPASIEQVTEAWICRHGPHRPVAQQR